MSDDALAGLVERRLDAAGAREAWAHASGCDTCAQLLASLVDHLDHPAPAAPTAPRQRWGRFLLLERLGQGVDGAVLTAYDERRGQRVALRVCARRHPAPWPPDVGPWLALAHPGLVPLLEVGVEGHTPWLVSPLVPGLRKLLPAPRGGASAQPVAAAVRALARVARALAAVHTAGLTHGAVTDGALAETAEGQAVLLDLGLGLLPAPALDETVAVRRRAFAPEAAASPLADQWALAGVGWRLLSGHSHRPGATLEADVPAGVALALGRALDPAPHRRFPSASELADALEGPGR